MSNKYGCCPISSTLKVLRNSSELAVEFESSANVVASRDRRVINHHYWDNVVRNLPNDGGRLCVRMRY